MYRLADKTFIELSEICKESDTTIFLCSEEAGSTPFRIDIGFKNSNLAEFFNFFSGNV
jgi:hypothetical protein